MKRFISVVLCLIVAVGCFSFAVSAASNNEKLMEEITANIPKQYQSTHIPQAQKIVNQLTISDSQYDELHSIIEETKDNIDLSDKTVHLYTKDERKYIVSQFEKALKVLNLHYTETTKQNGEHKGDVVAHIFDASGKELGTLDGDVNPGKTDTGVNAWAWALIAGAVAVIVAGATVYLRKRKFVA